MMADTIFLVILSLFFYYVVFLTNHTFCYFQYCQNEAGSFSLARYGTCMESVTGVGMGGE